MEDLPLGRTADLVPEFAVKDLPLDRTLWWWYYDIDFLISMFSMSAKDFYSWRARKSYLLLFFFLSILFFSFLSLYLFSVFLSPAPLQNELIGYLQVTPIILNKMENCTSCNQLHGAIGFASHLAIDSMHDLQLVSHYLIVYIHIFYCFNRFRCMYRALGCAYTEIVFHLPAQILSTDQIWKPYSV